MKTFNIIFMSLLLALGLTACAGKPILSEADQAAVRYHDKSLEGQIEVVDIKRTHSGDVMRVQVTFENRSAFATKYQYKFRWFDGNGFEVSPERSPWTPQNTPGRGTNTVQATAPNPSATHVEIWFKQ